VCVCGTKSVSVGSFHIMVIVDAYSGGIVPVTVCDTGFIVPGIVRPSMSCEINPIVIHICGDFEITGMSFQFVYNLKHENHYHHTISIPLILMVTPAEYITVAAAVPLLVCGTNHVIHSGHKLANIYWRCRYYTASVTMDVDPDAFGDLATLVNNRYYKGKTRDPGHTTLIRVVSRGAIRLRRVPAPDEWIYIGDDMWLRSGRTGNSEGVTGFTLYYQRPETLRLLERMLAERRQQRKWLRLEPAVSGPMYFAVLAAIQSQIVSEYTVCHYTVGPKGSEGIATPYFMKTPCPAVAAKYRFKTECKGMCYMVKVIANPGALVVKIKNPVLAQEVLEEMLRQTSLPFRNREVPFVGGCMWSHQQEKARSQDDSKAFPVTEGRPAESLCETRTCPQRPA
jgi:hypothetical protein